jgi:hypothetical protein
MAVLIHIYFIEEIDSLALLKVSFIQCKKQVRKLNIDNFEGKLCTKSRILFPYHHYKFLLDITKDMLIQSDNMHRLDKLYKKFNLSMVGNFHRHRGSTENPTFPYSGNMFLEGIV